MRFTIPAINNDYYDEDYLRVFGFKSLGKNIKVHRSVVFMKPSSVTIGDNVTIGPYCVFGMGSADIVHDYVSAPFSYFGPGIIDEPIQSEADRVKELEAKLAAYEAVNSAKKNPGKND